MITPTHTAREHLARWARRIGNKIAAATTPRRTLAAVSALVAVSLTGVGGTAALWTGSVKVDAPAVTSGSIVADIGDLSALTHTYTAGALSKTVFMSVSNSGSIDADYVFTVSTGPGTNATMAAGTSLVFWFAAGAASCTEHEPVGASGWSGTLDAVPAFSGGFPAGYTGGLCLRTRLDADLLTTTATVVPVLKLDLTVPDTGWSSSDTVTATQRVTADAAVGNDYTDAVRTDGAQHYWRLGESTGRVFYDWAGTVDAYAGTGLVRGSESAIVGDPNTSTTFPNTASGMAGTRVPESGQNAFGVEAWFKTTSTTGGKIIGFGSAMSGLSGNYDRHLYMDATGRVTFGVFPGAQKKVTSAAALNDGAWHHVVGNLGPNGLELYVDGVRVGHDATVTTAEAYSGYWRIGGDSTWDVDPYFDGIIDEVAVYGNPLSASAIANHRNISGRGAYPAGTGDPYAAAVYDDAPALFWRLGESGTTTTAADSSGNGNTGTYGGSITKSVAGAVSDTRNKAAQFNGGNGLVASTAQFVNPQNYSVELWFKTSTTTGGKLIGFGNAQTGNSTSYDRHIYMLNDGKLVFGSFSGSTQVATSTSSYNNGRWHHVVATQSSTGGMILYINGVQVATNAATAAQNFTGYWRVGGDSVASWPSVPTSQYITATIDEVAVYNKVLTATSVQRHFGVATGAPVAAFSATMSGLNASVNGSASTDLDGSITGYSWNWGDGTATSTGVTATHSYATPGTYVVTLTVTDNSGKTSKVSNKVIASDITAPATPAAPTLTSRTPSSVTLSWPATTDNVGVTQYQVYRNGTAVGTTTSLSYTDSGLAAGTSYSYSVRARDAAGNWSQRSTATSMMTQYSAITAGTFYSVKNLASNKCVQGMGSTSPSQLQQFGCVTATNQNFRFVANASGYFRVEYRPVTTLVWDLSGTGRMHLFNVHDQTNQQWEAIRHGNGSYSFRSVSNPAVCMQFNGGSTVDGTEVWPATCNTASNTQRFALAVAP
jgi:PKD repeat protein